MVDLEPSRRIALIFQNLKKFCRSGPVKFGEKSSNVKPAGNHPYYFVEWSDHVQEDIRLVRSS